MSIKIDLIDSITVCYIVCHAGTYTQISEIDRDSRLPANMESKPRGIYASRLTESP